MQVNELQKELEKLGYFMKVSDKNIFVYAKSGTQVARLIAGFELPIYYQAVPESTKKLLLDFAKSF